MYSYPRIKRLLIKNEEKNFDSSIEKHWSRQKKRGLYVLKIIMIFMY